MISYFFLFCTYHLSLAVHDTTVRKMTPLREPYTMLINIFTEKQIQINEIFRNRTTLQLLTGTKKNWVECNHLPLTRTEETSGRRRTVQLSKKPLK